MSDFVAVAESLRIVRKAREKFLALWALECLMDQKQPFDALWLDSLRQPRTQENPRRRKGRGPGRRR